MFIMSGKLKNILITWTSSGIWKSLKNNFQENYNIIWISRNHPLIPSLESRGSTDEVSENYHHISIDLWDISNLEKISDYLEKNNIILDTLILNAGIWFFDEFWNISEENYMKMLDINLKSPIILTQKLLPYLSQKAKIIFIGSICSKKFMKFWAVYQATKFGIRWFAGSLKNELKWKKIHLINPKIVETNFHNNSHIAMDIHQKTEIWDILSTIENIFSWYETRFEIDL